MGNSDFNRYIRSEEFKNLLSSYEAARLKDEMLYLDSDDLIDIAEYYHSINEYDSALDAADYCLELHPDESAALLFKARMMLIDNHDPEGAREVFSKVKDPDNYVESTYIRAELLIYDYRLDEADALLLEKYSSLLSKSSNASGDAGYDEDEEDGEGYDGDAERMPLDVAMMYVDLGMHDMALEWMQRMETPVSGMEYEYYETWARISHSTGDSAKVIEYLNKALDYDPYSINAWMQLYDTYFNIEQYEKALECTEYALAIEPDDAEALMCRGNTLYELNRTEEAIETYKTCAQMYPEQDYPCMILGTVYLEHQDFKTAMGYFREAIERSGYDIMTMAHIGMIFYEMGYYQSAYQIFHTIITPFHEEAMMDECPLPLLKYMVNCCIKLDKEEELRCYYKYLEQRKQATAQEDNTDNSF